MRITDLPIWREVKESYVEHRKDGKSRDDAVMALIQEYMDELIHGTGGSDQLFWVGLAEGQYYRKELSQGVANKATNALMIISGSNWNVYPGDIRRLFEKYKKAPMPERKVKNPRPKFRCPWDIGDTYAYLLSGEDAQVEGIAGKYALLRKVDEHETGDGGSVPVLTVTLWDSLPFPSNAEEFAQKPLMLLCNGGRMGTPEEHGEYRAELIVDSIKQFRSTPFEYVGHFPNTPMPENEIIFTFPGETLMFRLHWLDRDISIAKKFDRMFGK